MITLQFVEAAGLGARAIQIFERGWASHVDAVLPDGTLLGARDDAVGGQPAGVRIRPLGYEKFLRVERLAMSVSPAQEQAWLAFLTAQLGKPYDELAIAAFPVQRDWREPDSWFCSELQAAAIEHAMLPYPLALPCNEITPRDLYLMMSGWATRLVMDGPGWKAA